MKTALISFIFYLSVCISGNSQNPDKLNYVDENGLKQGHWIKKYDNGNTRYDGYFKNGKPVGLLKRYYRNKALMAELYHSNDTVRAKLYFVNGKPGASGIFVNQKKDSIWEYYAYYGGYVISKENYVNGLKEGISRIYFENGRISDELNWVNDIKNGSWQTYFKSGNVKSETLYKNGKIHGIFNLYFPSGVLKITGKYANGVRNEKWLFFNEDGTVTNEIEYINGVAKNRDEQIEKLMQEFEEYEKNRHKIKDPEQQMYEMY